MQLNEQTVKKVEITLMGKTIACFKDLNGQFYIDQSYLAKLINKDSLSVLSYFNSDIFKNLIHEDEYLYFEKIDLNFPYTIEIENKYYKLIPIWACIKYIRYFDLKGNVESTILIDTLILQIFEYIINYFNGTYKI